MLISVCILAGISINIWYWYDISQNTNIELYWDLWYKRSDKQPSILLHHFRPIPIGDTPIQQVAILQQLTIVFSYCYRYHVILKAKISVSEVKIWSWYSPRLKSVLALCSHVKNLTERWTLCLSHERNQCAALLLSPCGPTAQSCCWRSPPPASGNVWRRGCGSRSSRLAPLRRRWRWPCRRKWPCPCLQTSWQRSGDSPAMTGGGGRRVGGGKPTKLVEEHEGVLGGVVQDARRLAQLHKESALPWNTEKAGDAW